MGNSPTEADNSDFYVGYLPVPTRHKRFIRIALPLLLLAMMGLGLTIAGGQRDPGASAVFSGEIDTWSGTAFMNPFPMLLTDSGEIHLLMGMGKFGVADLVEPYDGTRIIVDGWPLARSDRHGIQLAPESNAIRQDTNGLPPAEMPAEASVRSVSLSGEIVDGKCYIGAMKPGDGKGHKACAILCIASGLPPLFASSDPSQFDFLPLLRVNGKTELPPELLKLAGEPVSIVGELKRVGNLMIIDTTVQQVSRRGGSASNLSKP